MRVRVRHQHGPDINIDLEGGTASVGSLRAGAAAGLQSQGRPPESYGSIRLIYLGRVLHDGEDLRDIGFTNGSVVHMVLQPPPTAPAASAPSNSTSSSTTSSASTSSTTNSSSTPPNTNANPGGRPRVEFQNLGNGVSISGIHFGPGENPTVASVMSAISETVGSAAAGILEPLLSSAQNLNVGGGNSNASSGNTSNGGTADEGRFQSAPTLNRANASCNQLAASVHTSGRRMRLRDPYAPSVRSFSNASSACIQNLCMALGELQLSALQISASLDSENSGDLERAQLVSDIDAMRMSMSILSEASTHMSALLGDLSRTLQRPGSTGASTAPQQANFGGLRVGGIQIAQIPINLADLQNRVRAQGSATNAPAPAAGQSNDSSTNAEADEHLSDEAAVQVAIETAISGLEGLGEVGTRSTNGGVRIQSHSFTIPLNDVLQGETSGASAQSAPANSSYQSTSAPAGPTPVGENPQPSSQSTSQSSSDRIPPGAALGRILAAAVGNAIGPAVTQISASLATAAATAAASAAASAATSNATPQTNNTSDATPGAASEGNSSRPQQQSFNIPLGSTGANVNVQLPAGQDLHQILSSTIGGILGGLGGNMNINQQRHSATFNFNNVNMASTSSTEAPTSNPASESSAENNLPSNESPSTGAEASSSSANASEETDSMNSSSRTPAHEVEEEEIIEIGLSDGEDEDELNNRDFIRGVGGLPTNSYNFNLNIDGLGHIAQGLATPLFSVVAQALSGQGRAPSAAAASAPIIEEVSEENLPPDVD